jgi:hypothetical protein
MQTYRKVKSRPPKKVMDKSGVRSRNGQKAQCRKYQKKNKHDYRAVTALTAPAAGLTTRLHLVTRLRTHGAVPTRPHTPAVRACSPTTWCVASHGSCSGNVAVLCNPETDQSAANPFQTVSTRSMLLRLTPACVSGFAH